MTEDEERTRRLRLANYKFVKEYADFIFRVVQMWIVLALVTYFRHSTDSVLSEIVMLALSAALLFYVASMSIYLIDDWEINRGKDLHGLIHGVFLLVGSIIVFPLLFSDFIASEINRITHTTMSSPAIHTPHG